MPVYPITGLSRKWEIGKARPDLDPLRKERNDLLAATPQGGSFDDAWVLRVWAVHRDAFRLSNLH